MGGWSSLFGGGSTPQVPSAADQTAQNLATATSQSLLNNPNQVTPQGSLTYTMGPDGRPTATTTLSPAQQQMLTASNQAQLGGLNILNQNMPNIASALQGPFGLAGAPNTGANLLPYARQTQTAMQGAGPIQSSLDFSGAPGLVGTDQATRQAVADAQYKTGAQYLDPQFAQAKSDFDTQMANQGITQGSAAYDRALTNFNLNKQKAYSDLTQQSILSGNTALQQEQAAALANRGQITGETQAGGQFANAAQAQQFQDIMNAMLTNNAGVAQAGQITSTADQMANAARQQQYQEYVSNRTMPINQLTALLGQGQIQQPNFVSSTPTQITPTNLLAAPTLQGQLNAAGSSAASGILGGILGAGSKIGAAQVGAGLPLFGFSDRRLKTDIKRVGATDEGLNIYKYRMFGKPMMGVMAQEVEKVKPEAVVDTPFGFKAVDYSQVA